MSSEKKHAKKENVEWHKVAEIDELGERQLKSATAGVRTVCLVKYQGQYAAMDNRCPHKRGPLGDGTIEQGGEDKCWIRCPWHGWEFDPLTGKPPKGQAGAGQELFRTEERPDGVYVGLVEALEEIT